MRRPISEPLARRSLEAYIPLLAVVAAQDTLFMMRNHPAPSGGREREQRDKPDERNKRDKPNEPDQPDKLLCLQIVELVDEPLELGHGVAALVDGDLLIDGEGHGFDGGAHLVNGVLIGRGP